MERSPFFWGVLPLKKIKREAAAPHQPARSCGKSAPWLAKRRRSRAVAPWNLFRFFTGRPAEKPAFSVMGRMPQMFSFEGYLLLPEHGSGLPACAEKACFFERGSSLVAGRPEPPQRRFCVKKARHCGTAFSGCGGHAGSRNGDARECSAGEEKKEASVLGRPGIRGRRTASGLEA